MNVKLIDKLMARRSARAQAGFTMVELAIVLVVAGLILVAALKGTDMINKAKVERAVADLKGLQSMVLEYQKRTGRLPGDCNNDGKIGYFPVAAVYNSVALDATETNRALPSAAAVSGVTANCAASDTVETEQNIVWNDMRRNNIVDSQRLPAELAKNASGSFYSFGNMTEASGNNANVIVVYSIPVWLAEAIDASIDGVVSYSGTAANAKNAEAITGRVRRWDQNVTTALGTASVFARLGTFSNGYAIGTENRDSLISISYQFDVNKLPETP